MVALFILLLPPIVAMCVAIAIRHHACLVGWTSVACAALSFAASVTLALQTIAGPNGRLYPQSDLWDIDALSALLAVCIAFVALFASLAGPGSKRSDAAENPSARRFGIFMNAFAAMMLAGVTVQNVALMWVAIEATTIASAMIIPLHRTKASIEASWKYILICSVGIALAFAGTVLAYFDFVTTVGEAAESLNWTVLRASAPSFHPELVQLAFAFILVGYGTKAGLAPMHTWLPDAHSEAPSAVSAMMSGVLLAVAMYAIARWKSVVDAVVAPAFTNGLLLGAGLLSLVIGTFSLVVQRNYKRMLAYSSIEHMGLVAIGLGLGPLGVFAAWLHVVNHAVAKSVSFLLAGRILHRYDTTEIAKVSGLLRVMPLTGRLFAAGMLALVGLPPFGLFVSEFLLVRAAMVTHHYWLAGAMLLCLLTAFISLLSHLNRMLYGDGPVDVQAGERRSWMLAASAVPVGVLLVLGLSVPESISTLINQCVVSIIP